MTHYTIEPEKVTYRPLRVDSGEKAINSSARQGTSRKWCFIDRMKGKGVSLARTGVQAEDFCKSQMCSWDSNSEIMKIFTDDFFEYFLGVQYLH